ncbi:MAG: D-aminoacyl-tRNA deacylase [Armatimonadota bacterium]
MRVVVQRVSSASVAVNGEVAGEIGKGLAALVGVGPDDDARDVQYLIDKLLGLRVFEDDAEKMNLSVSDVQGGLLLVPNFTLYGDCRKGRRPSFTAAAPPERAEQLFNDLVTAASGRLKQVAAGVFGAHMSVSIANDGPVTLLLDSKREF